MKAQEEKVKSELIARGYLNQDQAIRVLAEMAKGKASLKDTLLKLAFLKEEDLLVTEADILGLTYLNIDEYLIDEVVIKMVPEKVARTHLIIPVFKVGQVLTIATSDPANLLALDEIRAAAGAEVEVVVCARPIIKKAIDQYYGVGGNFTDLMKSLDGGTVAPRNRRATDPQLTAEEAGKAAEEAPVIKLVNMIIMKAVEEKASDIHIEPEEDLMRVRNRVDGVMHESLTIPKKLQLAVASRIKILSKIDIAETRKPQDGKIRLKVEGRDLDIRVSTLPTMHGENIVMRLLEQSKVVLGLADLGFEEETRKRFDTLIHKAYGMVLVTGPTGAGKTTTLYTALNTINTVDKNIITIEDPVEYQIPMIRQTQVNVKAGLTFASGLRSILRQDPDVVLVGEIRDTETADIAVQAALTGHLVFSSIHTNDAAGAVARLLDMNIEPFLVSSALVGVVAQRLVRGICKKCKEPYKVDAELLAKMGIKGSGTTFYKGKGCTECNGTGHGKRMGIYELLFVDEPIRRLIIQRASADEIKTQAQKSGMISMRVDGIRKAEKGLTTLEEVLKVTVEDN